MENRSLQTLLLFLKPTDKGNCVNTKYSLQQVLQYGIFS